MRGMNDDERLFKFLLKCQRNHNKPDLRSFMIDIKNGKAYVECRSGEVYIQSRVYGNGFDKVKEWCGTTLAAANRLDALGADFETIDM